MTTKLPCSKCGAMILPTTFQATGGVCMACKQGIRDSIESSKAHYQKQREYDPVREHWASLVNRVHKTEEGYSGLNSQERVYYCLSCLKGEVFNGGFHQFFTNSSGMHYRQAVDGLLELRAFDSLALLSEAKNILFGEMDVPADDAERNCVIRDYPEIGAESTAWCIRLEELNSAYWKDPDQLSERLATYAEEHGLIEPFKKAPPT